MKLKRWNISALILLAFVFANFGALAAPTPAPANAAKAPAAAAAKAPAAPAPSANSNIKWGPVDPGFPTATTGVQSVPGAKGMPAQQVPASLSDAYVTVVVGDLLGLIDNAGPIVTRVSPAIDVPTMRSKLGELFGDPALAGIPAQSGAAMVVFPNKVQVSFLEVAPASAQKYLDALTTGGMNAALVNGLLVIAENDLNLTAGKNIAAEVKAKLLTGKREPNIKAVVQMQKVVADFDPNMQIMLQGLAMMIAQQSAKSGLSPEAAQKQAQILEAELRGIFSLARQIQELDATLSPLPQQGLRLSFAAKPLAGSNLAAMAAAPAPPADGLLKMLPAKGAARGTGSFNRDAMIQFMQTELTNVSTEMNMSDQDLKAIQDLLANSMSVYGNSFAIDFIVPGQPLMSGEMLYAVKDPAAALAMFEKLSAPQGGFATMCRNLGVDVSTTFTKNVRAYKKIPIHRMVITSNMQNLPPQQAEQMRKVMGSMSWEIAIVNNTLVYAMSEPIDGLIDAVLSKANPAYRPLRAQSAFAPGANFYMDFDLGNFARTFAIMDTPGQPSPFSSMAAALQGTEPLMMSGIVGAQGLRGNLLIPSSLIAGFGKMGGMGAGAAPGMQAPPAQQQLMPPLSQQNAPAPAAPKATPRATPRAVAPAARPAGR